MRKPLLIVGLLAGLLAPVAFAQTQTFTYSYNGLPIPIYPDDWNTISAVNVLVPRSLILSKVTVSAQVSYSGVGDLNFFMWSPAGTRTKLLERNCGGLVNIDTTFDDAAPVMFNTACPAPGSGPYRGNEPLGNSNGQNAFGYWRFGIENNGSSKTGTLTGLSITVTGTVTGPPVVGPNTIVSTASFEGGPIAPGDQVTLIGVNLGPVGGVRADTTKPLPTTLGGTTVRFDGVAAPVYYASDGVVQVQTPAGLATGALTRVQVTAGNGSSAAVPIGVLPVNPAVFTYETLGRGQAKVVNADGSLNGDGSVNASDKPAAPGSVIQVYAAGLGPVDPPVPDGAPAPMSPLSKLTLPITASIGSEPATVTWAGASPGQIGSYQVNIQVPQRTASGAARLVISVNGIPSQNAVVIQVR